jgi:AraC-like DNA-binding protein
MPDLQLPGIFRPGPVRKDGGSPMGLRLKRLRTRQSYYKRIILFMLIFTLVLFIPFSIISYSISVKNISNSISFSNNVVLSQMNYRFDYITNMIGNICLEVYLHNNAQQFLYSQDLDYRDVITYMRNLTETTIAANPSIDSIVLYNHKRNEWISTKNVDPSSGRDLSVFIKTQVSIPRLKPILREITRKQGDFEVQTWVFSYFMYQFSDPVSGNDSYIAVNQDAGWFLDTLSSIRQSITYAGSIYLFNGTDIVFSNSMDLQDEAAEFLIKDFLDSHKNDAEGIYPGKYRGKKYLLSSIRLGAQENYLFIIQNHEKVFRDLSTLQKEYIVFGSVFVIISIIILIPFSRRIYSPVLSLVNSISETEPAAGIPEMENEFEYLQKMYRDAGELNRKLLRQSAFYEPIFAQHQLFLLVTDNTEETYRQFRRNLPGHWLASDISGDMFVLLFKIDRFRENKYKFEREDANGLSSLVGNFTQNFSGESCDFASFTEDRENLGIIIRVPGNIAEAEEKMILPFIENCRSVIKLHLGLTVSISYSGAAANVLNLGELYRKAREYLQYRFIFGEDSLINEKRCRINIENKELHYPYSLDEKLIEAVKKKDLPTALITLEDIKNSLLHLQYTNCTICTMELVNSVIRIVTQADENGSLGQESDELYRKVINAEFMDDFFRELNQYIRLATGKPEHSADTRKNRIVSAILEYIQNNYSNPNLSSQMIGDFLGMSNRYVMFKFMESTGISLNEYIIDVRMRKAANLLRNTDLPVSEIAKKTGIENNNYFYRLFKKFSHVTPREFSERYRNSRQAE